MVDHVLALWLAASAGLLFPDCGFIGSQSYPSHTSANTYVDRPVLEGFSSDLSIPSLGARDCRIAGPHIPTPWRAYPLQNGRNAQPMMDTGYPSERTHNNATQPSLQRRQDIEASRRSAIRQATGPRIQNACFPFKFSRDYRATLPACLSRFTGHRSIDESVPYEPHGILPFM